MTDDQAAVLETASRARAAANELRTASRAEKDAALTAMANALILHAEVIIAANDKDVENARNNGTDEAIIDRLTLNHDRIEAVATGLRDVASLPDPVGEVVRGYTLPNGLEVRQIRVPLGVIAMIYEARPNVTVDAAGLALKSGNCAILRGSSSAHNTNVELVSVMRSALAGTKIPMDSIQLAPGTTHEAAKHLMTARGLVDVIIPRGGAGLINSVVEQSTVPVLETGVGNCHVYLDKTADVKKAIAITLNAKTQRTSVCNTAETLLVHEEIAPTLLPQLLPALAEAGVTIHGDSAFEKYCAASGIKFLPAMDKDWAEEYYSLDIAAAIVPNIDAAIAHIRKWSTGHTEAIVSESQSAIKEFTSAIDSAAIMVNASTRFTDGGEFGFGAEIGISTQKLHARGPMGLPELTTTTYVVTGDGHIRQ
ncbi:MAG: glutamate-5-semialdehyde dehydrogenase [Actinomycetales bacterium]|nr:glutamate-5-semialdehyde dehydrogenase [Actinomycetales bacterium]